jgi:hypothetical protein
MVMNMISAVIKHIQNRRSHFLPTKTLNNTVFTLPKYSKLTYSTVKIRNFFGKAPEPRFSDKGNGAERVGTGWEGDELEENGMERGRKGSENRMREREGGGIGEKW